MTFILLPCALPLLFSAVDSLPQDNQKAGSGQQAAQWNTWRGPDGTCVARTGNPVTEWSEDKNIRWKVTVPGLGLSSPIIWKDRIYLTTAIETTREGTAPAAQPPGGQRDGDRRGGRRGRRSRGRSLPTKVYEFAVLALDRKDGRMVWKKTVREQVPHEAGHATASHASISPLTDGEHIYAHFGSRGIYCLDMQRKVKWFKDLGLMRTRRQYGEGSSPALFGDTLVVNWDHEGDSFVIALDKHTGKVIWRKPRDEITSWSTPLIVDINGRPQVIISATGASRSYDLMNGKVLWYCSGMTTNSIPTPVYVDGLVYLMSGFRGNSLQAIRLAGAKGDLVDGDSIVWSHGRNTSYVPSALVYDNYIYFLRSNSGILSCLNAKTGEVHYEGQRLRGMRTIYSSPVGAAGRIYVTSRRGITKVIKLGAKFEELATNTLDDKFDATAAIVGDELYLRGHKHLYCIAED